MSARHHNVVPVVPRNTDPKKMLTKQALLCWLSPVVFLNFCFRFGDSPFGRISRSHPMASNLDPILGKLVMDPLCTVITKLSRSRRCSLINSWH